MQLVGPPENENGNRDSRRREIFGQSSHPLDLTFNIHRRTHEDVRNQPEPSFGFLTLKEARNMIPTIDGESMDRVREFLNAANYAMKNIHPADEQTLLEAILCTKFKERQWWTFTHEMCAATNNSGAN